MKEIGAMTKEWAMAGLLVSMVYLAVMPLEASRGTFNFSSYFFGEIFFMFDFLRRVKVPPPKKVINLLWT